MSNINHSIKIKKNRKSYKISKDELKNKLMDEAKKYDENKLTGIAEKARKESEKGMVP